MDIDSHGVENRQSMHEMSTVTGVDQTFFADSPLMDIGTLEQDILEQEIDEEMEVRSDECQGREIQGTHIDSTSRCADDMEGSGGSSTRKSTRKRKTPPPSPPENHNGSQKPKPTLKPKRKRKLIPKLKLKLEQKEKSSAQESARSLNRNPAYTGMRNYFEEVEIDGEMRIVDMHDVTNDFVCLCPAALYLPLH